MAPRTVDSSHDPLKLGERLSVGVKLTLELGSTLANASTPERDARLEKTLAHPQIEQLRTHVRFQRDQQELPKPGPKAGRVRLR